MTNFWKVVIHTGVKPDMDFTDRARLITLNAFIFISFSITLVFIVFFTSLGSYSVLEGLVLLPIFLLVLYLNYKERYKLAGFLTIYLLMLAILALALSDRRTGTEYVLIAIGCCSVLFLEKPIAVVTAFLISFSCYGFYSWYDAVHPFISDPTISYPVLQNTLMFLSGFVVVGQSLVFRPLIKKYAESLRYANLEIKTLNEELQTTNEELVSTNETLEARSMQLNWIVEQKSTELQSYLDAINVNVYSAITNKAGTIIKVNNPLLAISGYAAHELIGQNFRILNSGHHPNSFFKNLMETIHAGKSWRGEVKNRSKNGSIFWIDMVIIPIKSEKESISYFLTLALPITDRREAEEKQEQTAKMLENIAFRTSHNVRGPVARVLGLVSLIDKGHVEKNELEKVAGELANNIHEMDQALGELTNFVNDHYEIMINNLQDNIPLETHRS